ncbi:glutamate--tRNA ligase [Candidatus Woesearchaeota archaeon]|nr:MAG: glutamate--tRNA ligase [Candidatus Woesearchaeota archaeon]
MHEIIRKYVLQNAHRYGKPEPGRIIGKVLGENPQLRAQAREVNETIREICEEVSSLSAEEILIELEDKFPELLEKKERKSGLKDLPGDTSKVVTRFAPSASGPLHIGHAYVASLNIEYAKKYGGKCYLRIEDTNPNNIDPVAYTLLPRDMNWLAEEDIEVIIQSDRLELYYAYALRLIEENWMYVCTCSPEDFRELIATSTPCPCRTLSCEEHVSRWKKMHTEFHAGEAVVRWRSDLGHKNPAMRDFPLFRIVTDEHPRQGKKYRVWPLMNFAVAIDDMELRVTHAIRGKDHADNAKRQALIHAALGHTTPESIPLGRINFEGFEVSTSKTREKIEAGEYEGWDDIRLPFLGAFARRGFAPIAFRKYAIDVGISKTDKSVTMEDYYKALYAHNKAALEEIADRYFFVAQPVKITVEGAPSIHVVLDRHPELRKGGREHNTASVFYIAADDYASISDGEEFRLRDCMNVRREGDNFVFVSLSYQDFSGKKIIHWSVDEEPVVVRMPDNTLVQGYGEKYVADVRVGDVVQFERFGFVRKDSEDEFWYGC